ncbi:MAG: lipoprotein-releasing ABC transporter permease subunit [Proteobacteria bacterium]|nr:lipoprotein-releasing ABC transporter permease subunit [Pseudomonadota bacterium]
MFKPLALFIALRYSRARRRNRFISFISLASIVGIALGIAVLITVLSVINGFDEQISQRFFTIAPQVTVLAGTDISQKWPSLLTAVKQVPEVVNGAPFINGQGMILNGDTLKGVNILGILPQQEQQISALGQQVIAGTWSSLTPGSFNIMIGRTLAKQMDLQIGDSLSVFVLLGQDDLLPRFDFQRFTVSAIFASSQGFGFDQLFVYTNYADAQKLLSAAQHWNGLHLKLDNLYQANVVNQKLQNLLPANYTISDWTEQFGGFFQTLAMQKTMLFVILLFIIGIAVFNLVSTLIMVVNEKRADIAILRTLGATPGMIMLTFILQGALIGLAGTVFGLIFGLLLAGNATEIVNFIQNTFHIQLIAESVYFVNYLPSKILFKDVIEVCLVAFGLSVVATIYPALIAFRTQPAVVLRYE